MATPAVVGTCMLMCPIQEMEMRQTEGLIHVLEATLNSREQKGSSRKADRLRMVKMFTRSAAGKNLLQPDLLRPFPILWRTLNYLLGSVATESDVAWTTVYHFVEDRLRAIRQDMIVQQTEPVLSCYILEPIIRFYVYASYRLCEESIDKFDPYLNESQLNECMTLLLDFYNTGDPLGGPPEDYRKCYEAENYRSKTRDEMEAVYGLLHLGEADALYRLLVIPPESISQASVVLKMSLAYYCNDYVTVFRQFRLLSPLLICLAAQHLPQIRRKTLLAMNSAYSSKNLRYPLPKLTSRLLYSDDAETTEECKHYGLTVDQDQNGVHFLKGTFDDSVKVRPPRKLKFIDEKLANITLPDLFLD